MEIMIVFFVIFMLYWIWRLVKELEKPKEIEAKDQEINESEKDRLEAIEALQRIRTEAERVCENGFSSMALVAAKDGKISREELRIIVWFSEMMGAQFRNGDIEHINALNDGVKMTANSDFPASHYAVKSCDLGSQALLRLYAAHAALAKPWMGRTRTDTAAMDVIESLILKRMAAPEDCREVDRGVAL